MQPKTPKLLEDVRDAAAFIGHMTAGKTAAEYSAERLLRQAVERNLEIIGEAVHRLARHDPTVAARIGHYQQIIAFRNTLIHGYDLIDQALVWQVVVGDVPNLEGQVLALLKEMKME